MAIVKLKKREELKILFAVRMPEIVSELYKEIKNKKIANSKLKEILNIKKFSAKKPSRKRKPISMEE